MKIVKIFLASSGELSEERKEFIHILNSIGKIHKDLKLESIQWETDIPGGSYQGKVVQKEINPLLKKSDIVILLVHSKLGKFTLEEYELAKTKVKKIFIYFKIGFSAKSSEENTNYGVVLEFKEKIEQENKLLFSEFTNNDQFVNIIKTDLNLYLSDLKEKKPPVKKTKKPARKPKAAPVISETYLNWLEEHCAYMNVDKLRESGKPIQVSLPEIYIPLYTQKPGDKSGDGPAHDEKERQIDIEELIGKSESLLIEGHPGSGKTTLLKHLAYALTQNKTIQGLEGYLPLLIFLKDTKDFLESNRDIKPSATTAKKILSSYYNVEEKGIDMETIEAFCGAKKTLLLLDGLDEIKPEFREIIVKSFADYRIKHKGVKVVLSGRPHGIDGAAIDRFGKGHVKILSLNMEQIEEFIKKWFHHIYAKSSSLGGKTAEGMISEIRTHPAIERLIDNPLMLTAICILYHDGKVLPGQRAELYEKFVDNMLYRRFKDPETVLDFLMALAFEMHSKGVKGEGRDFAIGVLRKVYERQDGEKEKNYRNRTEMLFNDIEPDCGLLKLEDGEYQFWHLTFQEYLTARYIIDDSTEPVVGVDQHWGNDWYNEVIELYIGSLSIKNRNTANKIVENIVNDDDEKPYKRWLLASRSLIDLHKNRRNRDVLEKVRGRLIEVIATDVKPEILVDAGEILGWLGDTRTLNEFIEVVKEEKEYNLEQGKFTIRPLEISKYPVTNHWFEKFVEADGYKKEEYWSDEGKKWLGGSKAEHPRYWNDRKWNCPNSPVVGVSWYEAYAFTRWLTIELKDGYEYRLPDENEWEAVAAGAEGRKYPWGDKWDKNRCNSREIDIGKTSPVGIFIDGKTPECVFDMSGNVLEWTDSCSDEDKKYKALRGGSWIYSGVSCRCADRYGGDPSFRYDFVGFRCARTLAL